MKENKYLIIDSSNVFIKFNKTKVSSKEIFNINKVTENNQKIILKLDVNKIFKVVDAKEFLTGIPFNIIENSLKKENNKTIITAKDKKDLKLYIENEYNNFTNKEIIEFYNNLKSSNELENYIKSLNILFKCTINNKNYEKKLLKIK